MSEDEFVQNIGCRIPYDDEAQSRKLIKLGVDISPNAAFMVLHEICRPPRSGQVSIARLNTLLTEWTETFHHPLVDDLLAVATAMIQDREISPDDAIQVMKRIASYPNQFSALSIAYFACDDIAGEVEAEYHAIIDAWAKT